ncbi:unnamed protein product [Schistosoma mattheei]|uniref:Uncharacterized protein n=1 Tax=Schistosoma mattheei TaxID=31246 RepID=A0A183NLI8_9TREM|nr:unnamed protein product [Schistosoma mattheei]
MFELNRGPIVRRQKLRTTDVFDYDDPDFVSHLRERTTQEDDPFALNWLQMGSTGSLGRHWRPGSKGVLCNFFVLFIYCECCCLIIL